MADQQDESDEPVEPEVEAPPTPGKITGKLRYHHNKGIRQLSHMVFCLARDGRRLRELVLLKDRPFGPNGSRVRPKSEVRRHDRPETELLLHRRDEVARLEPLIEAAEAQIATSGLKGHDLKDALKALAALHEVKQRHLMRIEDGLAAMGKELAGSRVITAKLASDYAHLEQQAAQHKDKMELAAKAVQPSGADLRKRLAEKYGVSEEEVAGLISARTITPESP